MRTQISLIALAVLSIAGCGTTKVTTKLSSGSDEKLHIVGKWKGKLEAPKKTGDDPAAKLAEAMMAMMGDIVLEFKEGDRYTMTLMAMPTEGRVEQDGNNLTLTAEKVMGMTVDEAKKQAEKGGKPFTQDPGAPMKATISPDGKTITVTSDPTQGNMVFERLVEVPKVVGTSSVSSQEASLVGTYEGRTDPTKAKPDEIQMLKAMDGNLKLVLDKDNTFTLDMMVKLVGKWKVTGNMMSLTPTEVMGMKATKDDKPLTFTIKGTTLIPIDKGQEAPFHFTKQ